MARPDKLMEKIAHVFAQIEQHDQPVTVVYAGRKIYMCLIRTQVYRQDKALWGSEVRYSKVLPPWAVFAFPEGQPAKFMFEMDLATFRFPKPKKMTKKEIAAMHRRWRHTKKIGRR